MDEKTRKILSEVEQWTAGEYEDLIEPVVLEAKDNLEILYRDIINLERREEDKELVDSLFRAAHNLKGLSRVIPLQKLNLVAKSMEGVLEEVRRGRKADSKLVDAILKSCDAIRDYIIPALQSKSPIEADLTSVVELLEVQLTGNISTEIETITKKIRPEEQIKEVKGAHKKEEMEKFLRVKIDRLDNIINATCELLINKIRTEKKFQDVTKLSDEIQRLKLLTKQCKAEPQLLDSLLDEFDRFKSIFDELCNEVTQSNRVLSLSMQQLQEGVMRIRMLPLSHIFQKFPRMVRDLSTQLGKKVDLKISGEETELDKLIVDNLSEPLMHIIRNCLDHGIELPQERIKAGKSQIGTLSINASYKEGYVAIDIEDDGKGIDRELIKSSAIQKNFISSEEANKLSDEEIFNIIFRPGFTTTEAVSELSGRGVGLDVVKETIQSMKGTIKVSSEAGRGTKFSITLPLTISIINILEVQLSNQIYALPLSSVEMTIKIKKRDIHKIEGKEYILYDGHTIYVRNLKRLLNLREEVSESDEILLLLIKSGEKRGAVIVDKILAKQDVVLKNLGSLVRQVDYVLGGTISGDGTVILILDPDKILRAKQRRVVKEESVTELPDTLHQQKFRILVVEDSAVMQNKIKNILAEAGFIVEVANDGAEALEKAQEQSYDAVTTDIIMPRMDGYELTKSLRKMQKYKRTPIIMITSKVEKVDRLRGFDVGADDYITKPFDSETVLSVLKSFLMKKI